MDHLPVIPNRDIIERPITNSYNKHIAQLLNKTITTSIQRNDHKITLNNSISTNMARRRGRVNPLTAELTRKHDRGRPPTAALIVCNSWCVCVRLHSPFYLFVAVYHRRVVWWEWCGMGRKLRVWEFMVLLRICGVFNG